VNVKCSASEKIEELSQQRKLKKKMISNIENHQSQCNGKNAIHHHGEKRNGKK
jgi:hypothetical protein